MSLRVEMPLLGPDVEQYTGGDQVRLTFAGMIETARQLEALGFDGLTMPDAGHDPYMLLAIAAEHTKAIAVGTNIAVSFPRSPMVTAQAAWDLQNLSGGRFRLGLGTQVKAHNERRFSTPWTGPSGPRIREYIQCLRAIFASFQNPRKPTFFEGQHYRFTMLAPFHNPGPIEHPDVPIFAAVAGPYMARLAGELCEGIRLHPLATFKYTREVLLPAVSVGAALTGRDLSGFELIGAPFMALGHTEEQVEQAKAEVKSQIAYYSTASAYHKILDFHGWEGLGPELQGLARAGKQAEMAACITDAMLEEWAIVSTYDRLADTIRAKCDGLFNTIVLVLLGEARKDHDMLREAVVKLHQD